MAEIIMDDSQWPIVLVRFPKDWTYAEWQTFVGRMSGYARRDVPFAIVNDARRARQPNAKERAELATWTRTPYVAGNLSASGIVVSNPVQRAVATAVSWLVHVPFPYEHFTSVVDAEAFCRRHLEGRKAA